ncbi:MAG: hypothetical protein Crog4KO_24060 [Crocinitomicaceae bacterium]
MSKEAEVLRQKTLKLLNEWKYEELREFLDSEYSSYESEGCKDVFVLVEIAGAYISMGSEALDKESIELGLKLFNDNRVKLDGQVTESSIEYCIANGQSALYKISIKDQRQWFITPESVKGNLFDAKQSYLKAFKLINVNELDDFSIQVLTNLGNNLNDSGRIVEALQLFDLVLGHNPDFPEALISKADGLRFMIQTTRCGLSTSLFAEMYNLYQKALRQNLPMPEDVESHTNLVLKHTIDALTRLDFDFDSAEKEFALNQKEYDAHPDELKFYLDNFLSLSEHALYCKCNEAKSDDLFIGYPGFSVTNMKIVELEHLLNRIKSEFSFARKQLFEFKTSQVDDFMFYQNFGVHELIYGAQSEKLRMSFRMCFGILDKIAHGVLHLFDLPRANNENTYFESFWKNPKAPEGRWEKFNEVRNTHLTALYSIACDLSKHNGEFSFYKQWRNQLEHDIFSLIPSNAAEQDVLNSELFSETVTMEDFEEKALHLLQLVRAAIFSFAFCCREELVE